MGNGKRRRWQNTILSVPKVLRGSMSIIGPPQHTMNGSRDTYSSVLGKPGITGLTQINYHDELSEEEVEKYNLYYAKNQSFLLDLEILLKTFTIGSKQ
jgi:lipopolysaccharide/colanic/teichoic acid biosynthesis glycosyltransferase